MISLEELKENYRNFDNKYLINLAKEPDGLRPEAYDLLKKEIERRGLEVEIRPQSAPEEINFIPEPSEELKAKYPDAMQIFSFEMEAILKISVGLLLIGAFFIWSTWNMNGSFALVKYVGLIFVFLSGFVWINVRGSKPMMVISEKGIHYKPKTFYLSRFLQIVDVLRLFFSSKLTTIPKSKIKAVKRPTGFLRYRDFYFETVDGDKIEINFRASEEYLKQMHLYLEEYIKE